MAEVVLEHVTKVFSNGVCALRDLNLVVAAGELLVLVGPSGCGKTTTLRLIAGLERQTSGTIRIGGREVNTVPPRQRDVAMVFQRPALYPHLTVRDNLAFGLKMRQLRGWLLSAEHGRWKRLIGARVEEVARVLGLTSHLVRFPGELSGGEQQRVSLGRALVREPAVFLLDEPLSDLDIRLKTELRRELHLLQRRLRATMIYVTHDPVEALTLGDRVAVLNRGKVCQLDRPSVLYDRPSERFVAEFIGWPPMNLLDAELLRREDGYAFVAARFALPLPLAAPGSWMSLVGQPLTLGIRPEDFDVAEPRTSAAAGGMSLVMEVTLVESAGHGYLVHVHRDGWDATAWVKAGACFRERQTVEVRCNVERLHLFERTSGLALTG